MSFATQPSSAARHARAAALTPCCLLQAGADVNAASAVHGHTALDVAVQGGVRASGIVELLVAKGGQTTRDNNAEAEAQQGAGEL